jgi:insertion element IS1 protein InsB
MNCPRCGSEKTIGNGSTRHHKPKGECKDCGRQFTIGATNKVISAATWELIDKLLLEKIPLAGIARVADISERWLQTYVNKKYKGVARQVDVSTKKKGA